MLAKLDEVKSKQEAVRHAAELRGRGENTITALKDEIDLLSGAATRADIELRKLQREGFEQDQIDEIAKLQQQRDALEKNKSGSESRGPNFAAALTKGSAEAISAINRAAFGDRQSPSEKKAERLATKQLAVQEKMLVALENKPEVDEFIADF